MPRARWQHILLAVCLLALSSYLTLYSVEVIRELVDPQRPPRRPFGIDRLVTGPPVITLMQPEAERAGLHVGDRIVAIDGEPYTGHAVLARRLASSAPGATMSLDRAEGAPVGITLEAVSGVSPAWKEWGLALTLGVIFPWLCLILGGWAAAIRPRDPLAWLLLALLMSFTQLPAESVAHWGMPQRLIGSFFQWGLRWSWAVWMMLFGVFFPERLSWERRHAWILRLALIPLGLLVAAATLEDVLAVESFSLAGAIGRTLAPVAMPARILQMASIGVFFMMIGAKTGITTAPDARRRLLLLNVGATVGLTPAFIAAILGLVHGTAPMDAIPQWLVVPVFLMMLLFPLTLAYVIVVHRALDVRVAIRQGVQYAFARGGVMVLRVLISVGIILAAAGLAARPDMRRVDIVTVMAAGIGLVFAIGLLGERLIRWTDRRFFRDALDAETILHELGEKVRTIVNRSSLMQTVAHTLSDSLHATRAVFLMEEAGVYRPGYAVGHDTPPPAAFGTESATIRKLRAERGPVRVYLDDPASWSAERKLPAQERDALSSLETRLLLPLVVGQDMPGIISLGPRQADAPYAGSDLKLLRSLATPIALALENTRLTAAVAEEVAQRERMNREVEIAREVQERLFPQKLVSIAGLDYAGACRPALGVGGDYYDFLSLTDGRLGIAIADVSGKGIGAALLMASLQASLRGQTLQLSGAIARLLENVNQLVHDASPDNRYATFFYGQYDPATRRLGYVNAGHCPPMVLRRRGGRHEIERLRAGGTVVGLFPAAAYTEGVITLEPGDLVVAYTDGISEAMNADDEEWGEQRLIEAAGACDGQPAADIIRTLMRAADAFAAGAPQHDDMTLVVARLI
ncbi:MAG: SpoIIE family protein phosphatase [Candidatus Polarisedimenticolia bacterium]